MTVEWESRRYVRGSGGGGVGDGWGASWERGGEAPGGLPKGGGWSSWVFQKIGKLRIFCNGRGGAGIC